MQLRIFELRMVDKAVFVDFWSKRYEYPNASLYISNIGQQLTEGSVWALYTWKNGGQLSKRKTQSVRENYIARIGDTDSVDTSTLARQYVETLGGGAIWNLFWLHCRDSARFPIFDQHTYRAMARILNLEPKEIPESKPDKVRIYFEKYLPFLDKFRPQDVRELDKALFAYGQFLKSPFDFAHQ